MSEIAKNKGILELAWTGVPFSTTYQTLSGV
jgi:hypothetical protein